MKLLNPTPDNPKGSLWTLLLESSASVRKSRIAELLKNFLTRAGAAVIFANFLIGGLGSLKREGRF
jgi:hypothetical protein